jgi:hypothetical protein
VLENLKSLIFLLAAAILYYLRHYYHEKYKSVGAHYEVVQSDGRVVVYDARFGLLVKTLECSFGKTL